MRIRFDFGALQLDAMMADDTERAAAKHRTYRRGRQSQARQGDRLDADSIHGLRRHGLVIVDRRDEMNLVAVVGKALQSERQRKTPTVARRPRQLRRHTEDAHRRESTRKMVALRRSGVE